MSFKRVITLLIILLVVVAISFAVYHRTVRAQAPFSGVIVTTKMLDEARASASNQHKVLMVEFGANWCGDCMELSKRLEDPITRNRLEQHFVVLTVDVGEFNRNLAIARSLGVDLNQGIPTAAFFSPDSTVPTVKLGTPQILSYIREVAGR